MRRLRGDGAVLMASLGLATLVVALMPARRQGPPRIAFRPGEIRWGPGPPSLPPGSEGARLEGDPSQPGLFTIRLRVPAHYRVPPHTHPAAERVTVLSGVVHVGLGAGARPDSSDRFPPGSYYVNPAGLEHSVWTEEPAEVQITGMGPWQLNYVRPADDPRTPKGP